MIKDAVIRVFLSRSDEVWSDSGKLDPISFGRITPVTENRSHKWACSADPGCVNVKPESKPRITTHPQPNLPRPLQLTRATASGRSRRPDHINRRPIMSPPRSTRGKHRQRAAFHRTPHLRRKNRSSQNASKPGLTAREIVIGPANKNSSTILLLIAKPTSNPGTPSGKLSSINWWTQAELRRIRRREAEVGVRGASAELGHSPRSARCQRRQRAALHRTVA